MDRAVRGEATGAARRIRRSRECRGKDDERESVQFATQEKTAPDATEIAWFREPFRMFQTNLLEVDADMDVEATLDFIEAFGCNVWLVNGGGIMSFYPSNLEHQTRNPFLSRRPSGDLFGDAVAAAHKRGIRVMARMDFSKVSADVAERHPDWLFVDPQGQYQCMEGQFSVDPSSAYYQEKLFEVLDEMIDRYPLDGFFVNMFRFAEYDYSQRYRGVSQSESARRGFAEFSGGQPHPTGPESPTYDVWRAYSDAVTKDLGIRMAEHIHRRRPDACLLRSDDLVFFEANNEVGRELWHHHVSEMVSGFRSHRATRAVLCHSVAFIDMPYRAASEQPEHMAQHLIQGMSRGANLSTYIMGFPGEIEYPSLEAARPIIHFHRDNVDVYRDLMPCARTGLVRADRLAMPLSRFEEANGEFRGLYRALQESHQPFDVVPAQGIAEMAHDGSLDRYALLILADVGPLPPEACAALDTFIAKGGRLVLTGSSAFDQTGAAQLSAMPARGITRTTHDPHALKSTYVTRRAPEDGRYYFAPVSPVFGAAHALDLKPDAAGHLVFLQQAPFGPPEKSYGHAADGTAGFYLDAADSVAIVPWTIGRSYHELGLATSRDLIVELVGRMLRDDETLSANLPEQVELTVHKRGDDLVVHLVNLSGAGRKNYRRHLPVSGGSLQLRRVTTSLHAKALVAGTECPISQHGDTATIDLPRIEQFEVIVIKGGAR